MLDAPKQRPVTIGVLSQDAYNAYVEPILDGLSTAARELGVRVLLFVEGMVPEDVTLARRLVTNLAGPESVDAILLLPLGYSLSAQDLEVYSRRFGSLPICTLPDVAGGLCSRVSVNNEVGLRAGLRHLIEVHAYQHIAFLRGPRESDEAELRFRVYREELARAGLPFDPALTAEGNYFVKDGIAAVARFWDGGGPRPEALVAANDGMALGALEELTRRGIAVPEEVALLGFDDIELARFVDPPLTTVRQPLRQVGRQALQLLLERVRSGAPPRHHVLPSELVIRESCGCSAHQAPGRVSSAPATTPADAATLRARDAQALLALNELGFAGLQDPDWKDKLYSAFLEDVAGADRVFLPELERLLAAVAETGGDISAVHKLIGLFAKLARRRLQPGSVEWWRADTLLHAARVKTSGSAERAPAREQVRFADAAHKLTQTSNALSSVVDQAVASRVLAQHLPSLDISACYVFLYEPGPEGATWARLVAGFEGHTPLALPEGGLRLRAGEVLPPGVLSRTSAGWYFVGPLSRGDSPGYAVFEGPSSLGFIFENLVVQLGGLERRIDLLAALVREARLREVAERKRMEEELAIAARIQRSILPPRLDVAGLQIAAVMRPATEVGGDYYDVIPTPAGGAYLGIGDVAGHGLPTGLVVLMLQSAIGALVRATPEGPPSRILTTANALLFENIHERMKQDEFITFTLARYEPGGKLTFAGAHEDLLIYRARSGKVEVVLTDGIWLAATKQASGEFPDTTLQLEVGDVLLLHTDGVTEGRSTTNELFGIPRLAECLERHGREAVESIRDSLLAEATSFANQQEDDMSLVVVRRSA